MSKLIYIPGTGNPRSNIMIIGEAPGEEEEKQGQPFAGACGNILNEAIDHVGWQRPNLYITNIVKVRPHNNRKPTLTECQSWLPLLLDEIGKVDPHTIILLGATASRIIDNTIKVSVDHGKVQRVDINKIPYWVTPMYHPSCILRGLINKKLWFDDWQTIKYESGV